MDETAAFDPLLEEQIEDDKDRLRRRIRDARSAISDRLRIEASQDFVTQLSTYPNLSLVRTVAAYSSRPSEPRSDEVLQYLSSRGIRVLLPVLGDDLERGWAYFESIEDLEKRAPGRPPEPSGQTFPAELLSQADLIIAPALAVDQHGNRLGQGGGWYDRALLHRTAGTPVLAMIYDTELLDKPLPVLGHDVPVDGVVTPKRLVLWDSATAE